MSWGAIASWLGSNAGNLAQLGMSLYGANQGKKAVKGAANAATPTPYSTSSPFGSIAVNPKNHTMSYNMASNPFAQLFTMGGTESLANAYTAPGSPYYGAAPEVAAAAAEMGGAEQEAAAQERYNLLNQYAQPEENRTFQRLENNLFATGRMGTTGGGEAYRGYEEARQQADLQRQMMAQDWAQSRGLNRFNAALQAVGSGQAGQMNQYNIGSGSATGIQNIFSMLLSQGAQGIGAGGGTPPGVALAEAQARGTPYLAGAEFLNNSGAFDALGRWIGSKFGGSTPSTTPSAPPSSGGSSAPAAFTPGSWDWLNANGGNY